MELTVLGSGTSSASPARRSAGYLLRAGEEIWIFDMGLGTLHRLLEAGVGWDRIDRIFFTHSHIDHHLEIVHLLFDNNNFASPRTRDLQVYGSAGFLELFERLRNLYGKWVKPSAYRLNCLEMGARPHRIEGFTVSGHPVVHIGSSVAYRVESPDGRVFVYSGDSDVCDSLVEAARRADLLLIEASTPNRRKVSGHLTPALAGEIASRAGVRRLMLTHFYPSIDGVDVEAECRETYSGDLLIARDLLGVRI